MLTDEQFDELKTKYKRVCKISCGDVEVVLRAPTRGEYRQCRSKSHDPASAPDAQEDLVRQIVVHPTRAEFDALLDLYPGLCENSDVSKQIAVFTGIKAADDRK